MDVPTQRRGAPMRNAWRGLAATAFIAPGMMLPVRSAAHGCVAREGAVAPERANVTRVAGTWHMDVPTQRRGAPMRNAWRGLAATAFIAPGTTPGRDYKWGVAKR